MGKSLGKLWTQITYCWNFTPTEEENIVKRMQIPVIWILGGPGTGKTTMAHRLCDRYKFTYISMGDLISHEVEHNSRIGKEVLADLTNGKLITRDILFKLIQHHMAINAIDSQGYILDGYPREIEQRVDLESKIAEASMIMYFKCTDATMKLRMYTVEDAPNANSTILEIRKYIYQMLIKISNFHKFAKPVIEEYPDQRKIVKIDAEQDKLKVYIQCRMHMDLLIRRLKRNIIHVVEEDLDFFT